MAKRMRVLVVIAAAGVACAQEPPNMHELECAIHTFAHAYGVSKVRTKLFKNTMNLSPEDTHSTQATPLT